MPEAVKLRALTRAVPPSLERCELTHLDRTPIDLQRAVDQHRVYEEALAAMGCVVDRIAPEPEMPDSVFVEDAAIVLDEIAIITMPGAASRRGELPSVAEALRPFRELVYIQAPGTIDGGDVLRMGKHLYAGLSDRTGAEGITQLAAAVRPFGYYVTAVLLHGCLHLKTAVTQIGEESVLLNPTWLDAHVFDRYQRIEVDPQEPLAGNVLLVGQGLMVSTAFPRTLDRLRRSGLTIYEVDASELAKAEGGLTCCSLIFEA
jgi:dimethylargininase